MYRLYKHSNLFLTLIFLNVIVFNQSFKMIRNANTFLIILAHFFIITGSSSKLRNPPGEDHLNFRSIINRKCIEKLDNLFTGAEENEFTALKVLNSWGQVPVGLYSMSYYSYGHYDQCVLTLLNDQTKMKYCFGTVDLINTNQTYKMGICIPKICEQNLALKYISKIFNNNQQNLRNLSCKNTLNHNSSVLESTVTVSLLFYTGFIVFATCCCRNSGFRAAISLKRNFAKLITVKDNNDNRLECLNGVKVISMIWIIIHHCFKCLFNTPGAHNYGAYINWQTGIGGIMLAIARLHVDSFFIMAALLLTMSFLKAREQG